MGPTDDPRGDFPVRHDPEGSRFVVDLPGSEAELVYGDFTEGVLDLQHTEVPPAGARVMATCPYVQAWFRRHPGERPS